MLLALLKVALAGSLAWQPRGIAQAEGASLAVLSDGGELLWWTPGVASGVVVAAHHQAGPVVAAGARVYTSGGWDPTVSAWTSGGGAAVWSAKPFTGLVTGMAACADGTLVVAGNDRAQTPAVKEEIPLSPGLLRMISADGRLVEELKLGEAGQLRGVVCAGSSLYWLTPSGTLMRRTGSVNSVVGGVAAAQVLAGTPDGVVVATDTGIYRVREGDAAELLLRLPGGGPRVLRLVWVDEEVIGGTSAGLFSVSGGAFPPTVSAKAAAFAVSGQTLLVLRENGAVESWDPKSRTLLASAPVPRAP